MKMKEMYICEDDLQLYSNRNDNSSHRRHQFYWLIDELLPYEHLCNPWPKLFIFYLQKYLRSVSGSSVWLMCCSLSLECATKQRMRFDEHINIITKLEWRWRRRYDDDDDDDDWIETLLAIHNGKFVWMVVG